MPIYKSFLIVGRKVQDDYILHKEANPEMARYHAFGAFFMQIKRAQQDCPAQEIYINSLNITKIQGHKFGQITFDEIDP
jgi:hypothetical protein